MNTPQKILEKKELWKEKYQDGWLAHYKQTGEIDWKTYRPPINRQQISGKKVNLSKSRLMLISSAGAYLPKSQDAFDASNPLGDYTVRKLLSKIDLSELSFAHEHYDHRAVDEDQQVLIPLYHLQKLVVEKKIGELTSIASFMGYQPDVSRVIDETIPEILKLAREEGADAALLVPS